jgi:superoxide dismutase, Fe-Mn family
MTPTAYVLPDLPYATGALEPVISTRIMELHHGTHHAAYVKGANELTDKLTALAAGDDPTPLQRSLAFNLSGHRLHSLFWTCMTPTGGGQPADELAAQVALSFGSTNALIDRMTRSIERLAGSGWAALSWDGLGQRLVISQIHEHQNDHVAGLEPILVIDGWEHAYYLQYEAAKAKWAAAFWDIVDWDSVGSRLASAMSKSSN